MSLMRNIYHAVLSEDLRWKIYHHKNIKKNKKLLNNIIVFLESPANPFPKQDSKEIISFLKENGLHVFPYEFSKKYKADDVKVVYNELNGLHYVNYFDKKLYFKKDWTPEKIRSKFSFLLNEQDAGSPHQYLSEDFKMEPGTVIADAGAAEGIFILPFIDTIKHAYLFETDEEWIEALNATFENYKDKVTIINKYVSDKNDSMNVSLDSFFQDKNVDFIKIDVDGAEMELLKGAKKILSELHPLKVAICTYHNQKDEIEFNELLKSYGFKTSTSDKFMLFHYDDNLTEPYLRRGIIRAQK
ncbi:MAG: FkbM family methyltransferase [Bacteroidetes bacterium]|nr:FkbM family methyltransferase [Bacteroidota bacterium]